MRFKKEEKDGFYHTLNERVNAYFLDNKLSKKMNGFGIFKAILFLALFAVTYDYLLVAKGNNSVLLSCFALMGFLQICLVLNLGHEGVHDAFSKNKKLNLLATYTFDLLGTSGYIWKLRHVTSHHPYPTIPNNDVDIEQTKVLTFQPLQKTPSSFKYQHIYAPILYCFFTLNAITRRDWTEFFSKKIGLTNVNHTSSEVLVFVISKIIYFTYALILPLLFSGCSVGYVLFGFFIMHVVASISAAIALFPAHLNDEADFPRPDENGQMKTTWAEHQMQVTMDFGTKSPLVSFFFGGINFHRIHHLFPNIAHVHFEALQKIMTETAIEHNIACGDVPSLPKAIFSHLKLLRRNGISHMSEII